MFDHDEYHIYTTTDRLEKRYVHLTPDDLDEAERLSEEVHSDTSGWTTTHRKKVADGIYLSVGDDVLNRPVRLQSKGYEGWVTVRAGEFEEPLFFENMLFHKCIGNEQFDPEWSFDEVRNWVEYPHREEFERQFDEYLTEHHADTDAVVDW